MGSTAVPRALRTLNSLSCAQEKDVDGHHSALALERYLKEIGIHEVYAMHSSKGSKLHRCGSARGCTGLTAGD
jgi:hypothetical protein